MKVQLPVCAHPPLANRGPCANFRDEVALPVTAYLYKWICVGGRVLYGECNWLRSSITSPSSACPTSNYNTDRLQSQLRRREPSDLSKETPFTDKQREKWHISSSFTHEAWFIVGATTISRKASKLSHYLNVLPSIHISIQPASQHFFTLLLKAQCPACFRCYPASAHLISSDHRLTSSY